MTEFAELICQSNFSFLEGASHPQQLITAADKLGYQALAITDECSVAGVVRAFAEKKEQQLAIKLIVGACFNVCLANKYPARLTLLCPNRTAYAELCRVITNSRRRAAKGEYLVHEWDLKSVKHCFVIWQPSGEQEADDFWLSWLKKHYGKNLFVAISRQLIQGEHHYTHYCRKLAQSNNVQAVATNLALMHHKSRLPLQHTLTAIKQGTSVEQLGRDCLANGERSLRSLATLNKLFQQDELKQSCLLAKQCRFELSELQYEYPDELIPKKLTPTAYLRALVEQGKKIRFPDGVPDNIVTIIEKELALISKLNYEHFFITIYDIVQFAKRQKILYQGRGSAANSVVCYCLEITSVDPE